MPVRATKRGAERTPLSGDFDVVICGASFAGLAVARELSGSGANVVVIDRYEVGERQTSACAAPTAWLDNLGLTRQHPPDVHRAGHAHAPPHVPLAPAVVVQHVRLPRSCARCSRTQSPDVPFDTAKVEGITRAREMHTVHTDRGDLRAPLVVDALGWRRVLSATPRGPDPAARGAALARAGGAPAQPLGGPRAVARPPLRARGLLVELPRRRRGARRRRLVRPARQGQGADGRAGRRARRRGGRLPGQLDPAPHPPRRRGRRLLRRRQRRPLPADDRRGDPHGAVLRDRLRARAARRGRGTPHARARRSSATRSSPPRIAGSSRRCGACSRCSA